MKPDDFQDFLLKSAVTVMACDGNIDEDEIKELKKMVENEIYFMGYDYDHLLKERLNHIKENGKKAINDYLIDLSSTNLNDKQELLLIEVLIRTIEADKKIEQNEVKFLQIVKSKLNVDEETIIMKFPKQINYLIDFNNYGLHEEFTEEIEVK